MMHNIRANVPMQQARPMTFAASKNDFAAATDTKPTGIHNKTLVGRMRTASAATESALGRLGLENDGGVADLGSQHS